MGKVVTPKYRIEEKQKNGMWKTQFAWIVKEYGKPTKENLREYREKMNESFKKGGVNEHISENLGVQKVLGSLRIVNQENNELVVQFDQPMFEII